MASSLVLASKSIEVTVVNTIKEVKQVSTTKFTVTFDADMTDTDVTEVSSLAKVINGTNVTTGAEKIKTAELDSTGKVLTVETYSTFTSKATYNYIFGDLTGTFTAANVDIKEVTGLVFKNFTANVNGTATEMTQYVSGINKDGVIIYDGSNSDVLDAYLTFTYGGEVAKGWVNGANVYINTNGYAANVTVKYSNYIMDTAANSYKNVTAEASATVTGVQTAVDGSTMQYAVLNAAPVSTTKWGTVPSVAAKDSGYRIYTRYKNTTDSSSASYTYEAYDTTATFIYESSNTDKLIITGNYLYPVSAGKVTVIVKTNTATPTVIGTFDLTIKEARAFASATASSAVVTVANTAAYRNTSPLPNPTAGKAVFMVADSLGEAFAPLAGVPQLISKPANATVEPTFASAQVLSGDMLGTVVYFVYGGTSVSVGQYTYKVTLTHPATGTTKDVTFMVNVVDGQNTTNRSNIVTEWRVELVDSNKYQYTNSVDLLKMGETKNLNVKVNGYNAAGIVVEQLASSEYTVEVKDSTGVVKAGLSAQTIPVITASGTSVTGGVTYNVLQAIDKGSYAVTVSLTGAAATNHASLAGRINGTPIGATSFTVVDNTTKSFVPVSNAVTSTTALSLFDLVKAQYNFTLNGLALDEANLTKVTYASNGALVNVTNSAAVTTVPGSATTYYISSVEFTVYTNSSRTGAPTGATVYKFDLNSSVTLR